MWHTERVPRDVSYPKKKPKQSRSKVTFDAILVASTYILERDGWAAFTTNRVAERAGVNIASLYQYFPNKEAIVEALRQAHVEASRAAVIAASADVLDPIAAMARALIAAHRVSPGLHRVLTDELPYPMRGDAECIDDPAMAVLGRRLVAHLDDPDLSLFVARAAVHAVIHQAACYQPEMLDRPGFEEEVTRIARVALRWPEAAERQQKKPRR